MANVQPKLLGQVVESIVGRDAGTIYLVVGFQERRLLLSDGREKKVGKPKKKNIRHVNGYAQVFEDIALKLQQGQSVTDEEIRARLNTLPRD